MAVINGGTIPDRGLYGVFLVGERGPGARVGELDEEMVFESRVGETFLLGASSWRIEEITHDRVLVSPGAGRAGQDAVLEGRRGGPAAGARAGTSASWCARLRQMPPAAAIQRLDDASRPRRARRGEPAAVSRRPGRRRPAPCPTTARSSSSGAATSSATGALCVLSPFGGRVHAPWAMAAVERARAETGLDVETMWTDDGFVVRFPETEAPPDPALLVPDVGRGRSAGRAAARRHGAVRGEVPRGRGARAAAAAAAAGRPHAAVAAAEARGRSARASPRATGRSRCILEAYRECLRDVFDMPALVDTLRRIEARDIRIVTVDSAMPSPFAAALLFGYVANYIYDGDAPLAERRAQALSIDQAQLRELLGEAELRELLDADALADVERQLQQLDERYRARSADGVHDLLLHLGDLTRGRDRRALGRSPATRRSRDLVRERRVVAVNVGGDARAHPGRIRRALSRRARRAAAAGLPESLLEPVRDAALDLARRYARTHGPFTTGEFAARYGLGRGTAEALLKALAAGRPAARGRVPPRRHGPRMVRRRGAADHPPALAGASCARRSSRSSRRCWRGWSRRGRASSGSARGLDALLDAIENLQGAPLPASILETEILAARIDGYSPADLDALCAAGEVVWRGVEPVGDRDGRVALYLTDHFSRCWRPDVVGGALTEREAGDR